MSSAAASILIVGGDSRLGAGLRRAHVSRGDRVVATTRRARNDAERPFFDLADAASLPPDAPFDLAYFCAGVTSLAQCERDPNATRTINVERTLATIRQLSARGTFIVFFSTNLVFGGERPHRAPDEPTAPRCEYGRQKAAVEHALRTERLPSVIVRLTKVLEPSHELFVRWAAALHRREPIDAFADQMLAPVTSADAIATAILASTRRSDPIVHVSASSDVSYFDAACWLARQLGAPEHLVRPTSVNCVVGCPPPRFTSLAVSPEFFPAGAPSPWAAIATCTHSAPDSAIKVAADTGPDPATTCAFGRTA